MTKEDEKEKHKIDRQIKKEEKELIKKKSRIYGKESF